MSWSDPSETAKKPKQYSLLHLILVAIIFIAFGQYLAVGTPKPVVSNGLDDAVTFVQSAWLYDTVTFFKSVVSAVQEKLQ